MVIAVSDTGEEDFKKVINQVAEICLSQDFIDLRNELEGIYFENGIANALLTAFQDALYAILAQEDGLRGSKTRI